MKKLKILKKLERIEKEYNEKNNNFFEDYEERLIENIENLTNIETGVDLHYKLNEIILMIKNINKEKENEWEMIGAINTIKNKIKELIK